MDAKAVKSRTSFLTPTTLRRSTVALAVVAAALAAFWFRNQWLPPLQTFLAQGANSKDQDKHKEGADEPDEHGHDHAGHVEGESLYLSAQARRNIGLTTEQVELKPYTRSASMPAIVVARPGRSEIVVTAPMGGRVMRVYAVDGEAIEPGQPLFDLRLTHEELVQAQTDFLRLAEQLDVELREIRRLEKIVDSGAIAGKRLIERQYEKQKIEAMLSAQRQSLLLHGLSERQVDGILTSRMLVQDMTVVAPAQKEAGDASARRPFAVRSLQVRPGQYVDAGAPLCSLMDYGELYIQGRAFEQDADELLRAASERWSVSAVLEDDGRRPRVVEGLKIVYVDNEIDPDSRSLRFYVRLKNEIVHESKTADEHRFITWRYKPGQRMQLSVPIEVWTERIVLPIDAVARDGAEYYVFQQNGDHFDRTPVHVEYQDQFWTVIANDGSIFPGDIVAASGAHQLQMALKNKAGGAVDPHAGHNH